jgi:uncharacterized protein (DUF305 family)
MPEMCRTVVVMKRTLAVVATILLVGCSGGADSGSSNDNSDFNEADIEFVQGMIPHHEQAVMMADMVVRGEGNVDLADLADEIRAAQAPEIEEMRALLAEWGKEEDPHAIHKMDDHSMHGMMTDDDLDALDAASGIDFERMWLRMMIEHHEGAITMSEQVLAGGEHPRVRKLAEAIIAAQRDEIARMNTLLGTL